MLIAYRREVVDPLQFPLFSWTPENAETPPGSVTFTRASTATVLGTTDGTTNWYQTAKIDEIRYEGLRRVENLISTDVIIWTISSLGGGSAPVLTDNFAADPGGSVTAVRAEMDPVASGSSDRSRLIRSLVSEGLGGTTVNSIYLRLNTGSSASLQLVCLGGTAASQTITVTSSWQRFSLEKVDDSSSYNFEIRVSGSLSAGEPVDLLIADGADYGPLVEQGQGVGSPPSDFVNRSTTYNANVPGVRYFATTNGNSVDGNGVVTEAAGASISGGGYLSETAGTNQMAQSDVNDAAWTKTGLTSTSDGVNDAGLVQTTLNVGTDTSVHSVTADAAVGSAGAAYFRVKAGTATFVTVRRGGSADDYAAFNIATGVGTEDGAGITSSFIIDEGDGWYKIGVVTADTGATLTLSISDTGTPGTASPSFTGASETVLVDHAQYESNDFPTSPIVTSGSAATRNADALIGTAWINSAPYSVFIDQTAPSVLGSENRILRLGTGANDLETDASGNMTLTADTGLSLAPAAVIAAGDRDTVAFRYVANNGAISLDTATVIEDTSVTVNANAEGDVTLGGAGASGIVHKIQTWDLALSNDQLKSDV